jgi:prepilin peptidase CpaA
MYETRPTLAMIAAVLLVWLAAGIDLRTRRIPNPISAVGVLLGPLLYFHFAGIPGLETSLFGLGLGLALMLPGYLLRSTGAGDVKLMAAMGALLGPGAVLATFVLAILTGAVIGIGYAASAYWRKGAVGPFNRYGAMLRFLFATGRFSYLPPGPQEVLGQRFAFGLPIAIGTSAVALWTVRGLS